MPSSMRPRPCLRSAACLETVCLHASPPRPTNRRRSIAGKSWLRSTWNVKGREDLWAVTLTGDGSKNREVWKLCFLIAMLTSIWGGVSELEAVFCTRERPSKQYSSSSLISTRILLFHAIEVNNSMYMYKGSHGWETISDLETTWRGMNTWISMFLSMS